MSWFVVLLRHIHAIFDFTESHDVGMIMFESCMIPILFMAPLSLIVSLRRPGLPGSGTRLGVNFFCFVQLLFPAFSYIYVDGLVVPLWLFLWSKSVYQIATWMFGVAALLYGIANARRHPLVSSSLFGGTGIEAMVLALPGLGPSHQSVGDEARDGAIRL
jgi:hypothetical protein